MALQSSGAIAVSDICVELGLTPTTNISLNDSRCRKLAKKETAGSTIGMSDFYGKSNFEYKAYIQNAFANFAPPGAANPYSPTTFWVRGFRIESVDQSIVLRRMVGYDAAGAVLFDKTASGKAEYTDNNTAYDNTSGWYVENTEWFADPNFNSITNAQYALTCVCYYTKTYNSAERTVHRVVVYDSNGNEYPIDKHRDFTVQASHGGATYPNGPISLNGAEIPQNN